MKLHLKVVPHVGLLRSNNFIGGNLINCGEEAMGGVSFSQLLGFSFSYEKLVLSEGCCSKLYWQTLLVIIYRHSFSPKVGRHVMFL